MFQKYGGREPTSSLGTEPPSYEPTTMKAHHKQHTHHPVTKTTQATETSATTESHLIRLVALETTEAIKPTNFTTRPATTTIAAITTPDLSTTTERPLQQRKDSTDFTTPATTSSTENYLKKQIMFISSATATEKSWTQSEQYDMTTKAIKRPLIRLVERTTTTSTTPVTSLDTQQPLSATTEKTSMHMEGTSDDEFGRVTSIQTKQVEYTVPHVEKSEQPSSATSDLPVHWQLRTTISVLTTDIPGTTQNLEYKTTPNLVQPEPETTSTTEAPLFKYETTPNLVQPEPATSTTEAPLFKYKTTPNLVQPEPETTSTTESPLFKYETTPNLVQPEPEITSTTEAPLFKYETTPNLVQPEPETTSTTEAPLFKYKTTPNLVQPEPEITSTTEAPLFKYKTTPNLVQPEPETTSTTESPLFKYETTPNLVQPEPEITSTTEAPLFKYKTTPNLVQPEPETTSTTEAPLFKYKTTPNLVQPEPETISTTEAPLFKYKTTDFMHSAESTEMTFITEHSQPENQATRQRLIQWLNHGKQSTDTVTSSTLPSGTDYSASFPESVTSTTIFEKGGISDYSESNTATEIQPISSSGTIITETEDSMKNLTTPATKLSNIISTTDSTSVNNQSAFITNNESTASYTSTAASMQSTIDRSTTPYNAIFNITDIESTTPTNLLTSSSSSSLDIQPIYTLVITDTSSDSTAITSDTGGTDATESSVSGFGDLSSQSISAVPLTEVSRILTTTDEPLHISVTGPTTAAVTTWHSPTASDETSMIPLSCKSQEIISNATVAPG